MILSKVSFPIFSLPDSLWLRFCSTKNGCCCELGKKMAVGLRADCSMNDETEEILAVPAIKTSNITYPLEKTTKHLHCTEWYSI